MLPERWLGADRKPALSFPIAGWFGRGAIGMILLTLLRFGVDTHPGLHEADATQWE